MVYLYRAVDKQGRTVDFLLSKRRDAAAAKRFFSRAAKQHGAPRVITLDGYAASHRAVTLPTGYRKTSTFCTLRRNIATVIFPLSGALTSNHRSTDQVYRHQSW
jgi:transposase-like protein